LDAALEAFAKVTENDGGDGLLKAHSGLRRGEIYLAQNRPEQARAEYERVAALPYEETRLQAQQRLRTLGR
jgi:predicted negative regulator of RcsB-dependent stress response